jgi:hypothetical protein
MRKAGLIEIIIMLAAIGFAYEACGSSVSAKDCSVSCENVRNTCTQKCNDDMCRTQCTTQFDDCSASCKSVMTTTPADAGTTP